MHNEFSQKMKEFDGERSQFKESYNIRRNKENELFKLINNREVEETNFEEIETFLKENKDS